MNRDLEAGTYPRPYADYAAKNRLIRRLGEAEHAGHASTSRTWTNELRRSDSNELEEVLQKYQGSQVEPERFAGLQHSNSQAEPARPTGNSLEADARRTSQLSPANSFVRNLMARAKMGQENYGGKGLMDIHPDYVRSQLGYPPTPPSHVNRLDPAGAYAEDDLLADKYLHPTGEAEVMQGSPQASLTLGQQSAQNLTLAPQHLPVDHAHDPRSWQPQHEMSSIPLISHAGGESPTREALSLLQEIPGGDEPAPQLARAPQEVTLKEVIRRSGSHVVPDRLQELDPNDYPAFQKEMNIVKHDWSRRPAKEPQATGGRTVRFADDESQTVTFSPAGQHSRNLAKLGLRKSQSEQNLPLQVSEERRRADPTAAPENNLQDNKPPASLADHHGLDNAHRLRQLEGSNSTQELQRQLQELRYMQHLRFPGNSPSRERQNAQTSPRQGQRARNASHHIYGDYYSKYYERQKQQQALRNLNHQFAIKQQRNSAAKAEVPRQYGPEQALSIGLGQPQNLAAFDVPLSARMSRECKGSSRKAQQGQGGSVVDQLVGNRDKKYAMNEAATPRQPANVSSARPSYLLKDGGQQRVQDLGNWMRLTGLLHPEDDPGVSARKAQVAAHPRTPRPDHHRARSHRSSQGEASGRKSSRTSRGGGSGAQASAMNLKAVPRKLSPAEAMSQGVRLHAIHRTNQLKKAQLREELDHELQDRMREKPRINQKSREMVEDRDRAFREQQPPADFVRRSQERELNAAFVQRHQECLTEAQVKQDDERKECTHRPKINRKSRTLLENRILQNLRRKAELYKMQRNPMYRMSQEGILIDMPMTYRPHTKQVCRQSPTLDLKAIPIRPNKYQIQLNKEAMAAESQALAARPAAQQEDTSPQEQPIHRQPAADDWKRVAVEQLLRNDSSQSRVSHHQLKKVDQHNLMIDDIMNSSAAALEYRDIQASALDDGGAATSRPSQHQHHAGIPGAAQGASALTLGPGGAVASNLATIDEISGDRTDMDPTQTGGGTLEPAQRNMDMPRMSATFRNPVINLQTLQQESSEQARGYQDQLQAEAMKAGTSWSLPSFKPTSISRTPVAGSIDVTGGQFRLPGGHENPFDQASKDGSDGHAKTQKSLRERIDERILKSKQDAQSTRKQPPITEKAPAKPSIDAIARGGRGGSRSGRRPQTARTVAKQNKERSASRRSDTSNRSKRSTKSKEKTKNFIILNAQQLARVRDSLREKGNDRSAESRPNLFEQKKIKIKKQEEKSRPALTQRDGTHEQHDASSFDNNGNLLAGRREFQNKRAGSLAKLKQNADLDKEIQLEKMISSSIKMQRVNSDFYKKNLEWRSGIERRLAAEKIKKEMRELDECSFTPRLAKAAPTDATPLRESVASGSQKSQKSRKFQVSSPTSLAAVQIDSIHYADYHKFRAEAAPKTYRELKDYQREVQTYLEKKAPQVQLRTERRGLDRQKSRASPGADQVSKSETTPRPPLPHSSRTRQGEKESDFAVSTFRANHMLQECVQSQASQRSLRSSDVRSSQRRFQTQSIEHEKNSRENRARRALHEEIQSIATSPKQAKSIRATDGFREADEANSRRGVPHTYPVSGSIPDKQIQTTTAVGGGSSNPFITRNSKELSSAFQCSEEPGSTLPLNDGKQDEVSQRVRRLGALYMQKSAHRSDELLDDHYRYAGAEQDAFDEEAADPAKALLDTLSSGRQNVQIRQGAQRSSGDRLPARTSRELAPPPSGRSNDQQTPHTAENNQQVSASRHSLSQQFGPAREGQRQNPSSFDNTSLPVASTHRESVALQMPFVPTPRTTAHPDKARHSEVQQMQRVLNQQEERNRAMNTAREQASGPFPYHVQQRPSEPFVGLQRYAEDNLPPEEFTLSQPARASRTDNSSGPAHVQPRPSAREHSSMKSLDWQVSQASARREARAQATPESRLVRPEPTERRGADPIVDATFQKVEGPEHTQFEMHRRYGGYAEPIQEKVSENAHSLERFSNMSKIVSISENTSQYDFLQHVTSIKDRQSHVTAREDIVPQEALRSRAEPRPQPPIAGAPPRNQPDHRLCPPDFQASSNASPMDHAELYSGLHQDLAQGPVRPSIIDRSLEFSREGQSDALLSSSAPATKRDSVTTMSLEVSRQNREVERIKDEVKRWHEAQAMAASAEAQQAAKQGQPRSKPSSVGAYQSEHDHLGPPGLDLFSFHRV